MTIQPDAPPLTVSAVTSVFNQEKTIGKAIESVLALGDSIEEYIILDDASTDNTASIVAEYAQKHPIIKFLRNETNGGCIAGFRRLFFEAHASYILVIPGDDFLLSTNMKALIEFAKANPGMGLYFGDIIIHSPEERRAINTKFDLSKKPRTYSPDEIGPAIVGLSIPSAGMLVDKRLISDPKIYRNELQWFADWIGNMIIALRHGAGYAPGPTAVWNVYSTNFSAQGAQWKKQKEVLEKTLACLRSDEYRDIYRIMIKYKLFNCNAQGFYRLFTTDFRCWDRYTPRILKDCIFRMTRNYFAARLPPPMKDFFRTICPFISKM
ncbi:MAG: putative glycosyltransferase EpsE [Lentisphaerae bacterium ADurb.Bin242]|nr:MAG: putative glycosyltransferase EpsE [Lentisphaerae bacterium ADurb.Bin242]